MDDGGGASSQSVRCNLMTTFVTYKKDRIRLEKSRGYWWDVIMGGLLTFLILFSIGGLILSKINLSFWLYPYSVFCLIIIIYYQWVDDNLTTIKTEFSKSKNFEIVAKSLDKLDWEYNIKSSRVDLTLNKYILKFLNPTIIPSSNKIYINFKYHSNYKTGRLPFYFGISTFLKWRFVGKIKQQLLMTKS